MRGQTGFLRACFTNWQFCFTNWQFCFTSWQFSPRYSSVYEDKRKHNRVFNKVFKRDFIKTGFEQKILKNFCSCLYQNQSEYYKDGEQLK